MNETHHGSNETRGSCTVNVPRAGLDWWLTHTFNYAPSTISFGFTDPKNGTPYATGFIVMTGSSTFNITSLMEQPTFVTSAVFNTYLQETITGYIEVTTTTPVAPYTTVLTQSAFKLAPSTMLFNQSNLAAMTSYNLNLPPATTAIAGTNGAAFVGYVAFTV